MSDPLDEQLRQALQAGGTGFTPSGGWGEARRRVVDRARIRRRRTMAAALAAALVVSVAAGFSAFRGHSPSRQVAAQGVAAGAVSTGAPGAPGAPGATVAATLGGLPTRDPTTPTPQPSSPPVSSVVTTGRPPGSVASTVSPATTVATVPSTTAPAGHGAAMVRGTVRFSPTCPVEQVPPVSTCAPRPGSAQIQLLRADGSTAASGSAGSSGDFSIAVAPGTYTVSAAPAAAAGTIGRGCSVTPAQVDVGPGATVTVAVACDTGIR